LVDLKEKPERVDGTKAFGEILIELASKDKRIVFVGADSCKVAYDFRELFPDRFYDLGVAEQNACSFSAGLAFAGKKPFFSAIAPFSTIRCFEQIRNDIVRPGSNVVIAGRGAGLSYATGGPTHNTIEEIGLLRSLPGIVIVDPADLSDFKNTMVKSTKISTPLYFRMHKQLIKKINPDNYKFEFGKGVLIKEGKDLFFISCGTMVYQSMVASEILKEIGISAGVINMHTIKPLDNSIIGDVVNQTELIVTVEEHSIINGLGSAVAEILTENCKTKHIRLGLMDTFPSNGPYMELLDYHDLTGIKIAKKIELLLKKTIKLNT
jgi:transketolase